MRNEDYSSHETDCRGECPRFRENAILFIHLSGKKESRFDLQLTFTPHIKECSLLNAKNENNTACMLSCPIFETYKSSHNY